MIYVDKRWKNGIEKIIDNNGILWLNESHKHLRESTMKYHLDHGKERYKPVEEPKNNRISIEKKSSNQSNYGLLNKICS